MLQRDLNRTFGFIYVDDFNRVDIADLAIAGEAPDELMAELADMEQAGETAVKEHDRVIVVDADDGALDDIAYAWKLVIHIFSPWKR